MTDRTRRLDELRREESSEIIRRAVDGPRIGFHTIIDVEVAPDLRHATLWVSVIGTPEERKQTLRGLGHAMPFVRNRLGKLRLKRIPELHLREDDTAARGTRVMKILDELERGGTGELAPPIETLPSPQRKGRETEDEA